MNKLLLAICIIQTLVIGALYENFTWVDTRLYSFESFFYAPYDSDYQISTCILKHMRPKDRKRIEAIREIAKK